jgi:hypothetical protein
MTSKKARNGEAQTAAGAVTLESFDGVAGTGRFEAARAGRAKKKTHHRGKNPAVKTHQADKKVLHAVIKILACFAAARKSRSTSAQVLPAMELRAMRTISTQRAS